ncbi:MAG: hypothetical protein QOE11_2227 [Solirubrobacteraceae bacterium]|jgi:hypothetical protein|nr:hypothetical protein [Solirubrobacteraceae bacterium]
MRERLIWISAGVLGLLLAAALASATSRVSTPDVGLAGEPVSAGEALAPPARTVTVPTPAAAVSKTKARRAKRATAKLRRSILKHPTQAVAPLRAATPAANSAPKPAATAPARRATATATKPRVSATSTPARVTASTPAKPKPRPVVTPAPAPAPAVAAAPTATVPHEAAGDVSGKGGGKGGDD